MESTSITLSSIELVFTHPVHLSSSSSISSLYNDMNKDETFRFCLMNVVGLLGYLSRMRTDLMQANLAI